MTKWLVPLCKEKRKDVGQRRKGGAAGGDGRAAGDERCRFGRPRGLGLRGMMGHVSVRQPG